MAKELVVKRGPGRPKGSVNKITASLKDALIAAAEGAGDKLLFKRMVYLAENKLPDDGTKGGLIGYLEHVALTDPETFAALLGKVLPMQVTGKDDGPITIEHSVIEADQFIANELARLSERTRAKEDTEQTEPSTTH